VKTSEVLNPQSKSRPFVFEDTCMQINRFDSSMFGGFVV
jgi:hypothetical protein